MNQTNRREFLSSGAKAGLGVVAGASVLHSVVRRTSAASPNEKIVLGMIGCGGRMGGLVAGFLERGDCEIAWLADCNANKFPPFVSQVEASGQKAPQTTDDFRRILDDKAVDAIIVATPDHWHAIPTVWGCQAGKHVYVEKPASHSPWEGRKMVEAARKYNRVVQLGTQGRSAPYLIKARKYIRDGKLGKIDYVRVFNQKSWPGEKAVPDSEPPQGLDYAKWLGPAPLAPYNANHHLRWNHFWQFSGGDIINDGVHQMDIARWLIDKDYPKTVFCNGGRYTQPCAFDSPDTQVALFDYGDMLMSFELTLNTPYMLKIDPEVRDGDLFPYWLQCATRIEIYGSEGLLMVGRHGGGWQVFARPHQRQPVVAAQEFGRFPDKVHKEDFVDAIRNNRRPNADIEEGHRSTLLCQLANISLRLGSVKLDFDPKSETCRGNEQANAMLKREYREPWIIRDNV